MQAETKVNDMRAPRTLNILEADAVAEAEGKMILFDSVRIMSSSGVCVIGMYKNTQPRNLGGPIRSYMVKILKAVSKSVLMMDRKSDGFIVPKK